MNSEIGNVYQVVPFARHRQLYVDFMDRAKNVHIIHGIFQVEITRFLERRRQFRNEGKSAPSMTGLLARTLGIAVDENKAMHAIRKGKKLIIFDDVDIAMTVEREVEGRARSTGYVLRGANRKSLGEIQREIREVKSRPVSQDPDFARSSSFAYLPRLARKLVYWIMRRSPAMQKKAHGTVGLTGIGVFGGTGTYWALPLTPMTLTIVVGGVEWRPVLLEDGTLRRSAFINLTISIDHDVIDGAPATRFCLRLNELVREVPFLSSEL